jgi:AraC-like DNA-binding protein
MWRIELQREAPALPLAARLSISRAASGVEFWYPRSDGMDVRRDAAGCRWYAGDEARLSLVLGRATAVSQDDGTMSRGSGMLSVADVSRPLAAPRSRQRELALVIPRALAEAELGDVRDFTQPRALPLTGAAALLAAQLKTLASEAEALPAPIVDMALEHCARLALHSLRDPAAAPEGAHEPDALLRRRARAVIERRCRDPGLALKAVARELGISRSRLFQAFAGAQDGLEAELGRARLARAHHRLLAGPEGETIGQIAFACGFLDPSTFTRMYKGRYGVTPSEQRRRAPGGSIRSPSTRPDRSEREGADGQYRSR